MGKHLAMHIAATNPKALDTESLDPALIERASAAFMKAACGFPAS